MENELLFTPTFLFQVSSSLYQQNTFSNYIQATKHEKYKLYVKCIKLIVVGTQVFSRIPLVCPCTVKYVAF